MRTGGCGLGDLKFLLQLTYVQWDDWIFIVIITIALILALIGWNNNGIIGERDYA